MRYLLAIILLFSCRTLSAQEYTPTHGRDATRGTLIAYPTAAEATRAAQLAAAHMEIDATTGATMDEDVRAAETMDNDSAIRATDEGTAGTTTEADARAMEDEENAYCSRIGIWMQDGNIFSTTFIVPFAWANRQVLLHLGWVSAPYRMRVNGREVAYNANGNIAGEFNLTRHVREGRNTLEVVIADPSPVAVLESWKGDAMTPALGEAWVMSQPTLRLRDVVVKTWRTGGQGEGATAEIALVVKSEALNTRTSRIHYELFAPAEKNVETGVERETIRKRGKGRNIVTDKEAEADRKGTKHANRATRKGSGMRDRGVETSADITTGRVVETGHKDVTLDMRGEDTVRFLVHIPDTLLWRTDNPTHYTLRVKTQHEGRYVEYIELPLGFRSVEMLPDGGLSVNGTPQTLRACEVSPQIVLDELAGLREQGYNTLRLLPGVAPDALYEYCDRHGWYVIAQAPVDTSGSGASRRKGGNPSNDPSLTEAFIERTADSYHATKRHPSVIAFSPARASANGIGLYESYLNSKRFGDQRPFIYPDAAGEWNSDKLVVK